MRMGRGVDSATICRTRSPCRLSESQCSWASGKYTQAQAQAAGTDSTAYQQQNCQQSVNKLAEAVADDTW